MKKKHLIISLIVLGIVAFIIVMISTGGISFDTFGQNEQTKNRQAQWMSWLMAAIISGTMKIVTI